MEEQSDVIHSLPCKIHGDINTETSAYFKINSDSDGLSSSFRGYPLNGTEVSVPEGYKGLVLEAGNKSERGTKEWHCKNTFKTMTYWNWNKVPSKSDPFLASLNWIELSKAMQE